MAARRVDDAKLHRCVELLNEAFRDGFEPGRGAHAEAGKRGAREGLFSNAVQIHQWENLAKARLDIEADETLYRPRVYHHTPPGAPVVASQDHVAEDEPEGPPEDVMFIGDAHDGPELRDKSRFRWLGAYAEEHGIQRVKSLGDWMTLDSLSSYEGRDTVKGAQMPSFAQDLDSFHESQQAFHLGMAGHKAKRGIVYGNHEHRASRWANAHPEAAGGVIDPMFQIEQAFAQWGWRTTPYGEFRFIGGVGVIHAPLNLMGKPYGGKTGNQRAANDAIFDIVRGDDHNLCLAPAPKIGPHGAVRVFSCGTAYPIGYKAAFAAKSMGDWWTGVCRGTIWGGRLVSIGCRSMAELKRRYGRSGEGDRTVTGWRASA